MYVIKTCFVSAPSRVFSGALVDCSKTVPNRHFIAKLNKCVLINVLQLFLFLAIETRTATGKSFHANGPATGPSAWNDLPFGVTGTALDWIQSFLVGRFQIFQIGSDQSSAVIVFFGLPQGTILGPLFYIVYTADLETIIEKHGVKMHLYTDDTQLCDHSQVYNIERSGATLEACL